MSQTYQSIDRGAVKEAVSTQRRARDLSFAFVALTLLLVGLVFIGASLYLGIAPEIPDFSVYPMP